LFSVQAVVSVSASVSKKGAAGLHVIAAAGNQPFQPIREAHQSGRQQLNRALPQRTRSFKATLQSATGTGTDTDHCLSRLLRQRLCSPLGFARTRSGY
jgi:hypothetical protein